MQILNIIFIVAAIIASYLLMWFAITAWGELRRLNRKLAVMERSMTIVTTITMGQHVRGNFEQLNEMKAAFRRLVENEQYEDAEELRRAIIKMEHHAKEAMDHFKDICGDNLCEVIVTKVKNHIDEED